MKTLRFRTMHETHPGMRRRDNEDAVALHPGGQVWAVADGMGGHQHGRFASDSVVRILNSTNITGAMDEDTNTIERAITAANRLVFDRARVESVTIGTTIAALYASGGHATCFWVGDSRIYRLSDGGIELLTRDHTQVRHLIETRQITADQAKNHPMSHVITRAIGVDPTVRIDTRVLDIAPDDAFLICSDGLTACVEDSEIADAFKSVGPNRVAETLLELCLQRGAPDNVSIVVVVCDEVTAVEEEPVPVMAPT